MRHISLIFLMMAMGLFARARAVASDSERRVKIEGKEAKNKAFIDSVGGNNGRRQGAVKRSEPLQFQ